MRLICPRQLLVGVEPEEGTEIVSGTTATLLFPLLSVAVTTIGKFWIGCANTPATTSNCTGFVKVKKPWAPVMSLPLFGGSAEVFTPREGDVPGLAVTETCTA